MISQHQHNNQTSEQPAFSFTNVHQSFASTQALSGFSLEGKKGSVIGLVGRNGAGKSTAFDAWWDLQNQRRATCASWALPLGIWSRLYGSALATCPRAAFPFWEPALET